MDANLHESTLLDQQDVSTEAPKQQAVTLDEAQNYVRPTFTGSYVDVTLKRKLNTNEWNTLCLPFPLSAAQIAKLWGAGSKVAILTGDSETKLFFSTCDNIEAGKPCLLDPKTVNADHTYEIKGIEVSTWENNSERQYVAGKTRMVGFFSPTMVKEGSYVFGDANKMYHLVSDMKANGFRCYFEDVAGASRVFTWVIDDNTIIMNDVKSITIPEGKVVKIEDNESNVIWSTDLDPNKSAYGIRWDNTVPDDQATTACERIGNLELHKTLPIQSRFATCIHQGTDIKYWCDPNDSRFRKDNTGFVIKDSAIIITQLTGKQS